MDREKKRLVDDQYAFVKQLLLEHETKLKELADRLLVKEVRLLAIWQKKANF